MTVTGAELLHRITSLLERSGDALVRDGFGMTYSRALLLRAVAAQPGISQRELANALGYTAPAVSSLLKEIRLAGLVTVATSSTSKRINEVFLTAVGAELETKISQTLDARFKDVLRAASVNDGQLTEVLARIEAVLSGKKEQENG
ncbi:MAG TPA: MarR family winged helix-turn-helix transcriptional regulator [Candidatus Yaniella excrementigallinarum]|nr:MarR family winged helix-turn-helix transcriptional regulator [Candidatus Yaniella excrementigallinarum]